MKATLLIFCFAWLAYPASAQVVSVDTDEVKWTVSGLHDTHDDSKSDYNCYFISSSNKLTWVQGDYVLEFTITRVTGSWKDLSKDGSKRYEVTLDDKAGEVVIKRKNADTTIEFTFLENGENVLPYIFFVNDSRKNL